jgi:hypothetical protein
MNYRRLAGPGSIAKKRLARRSRHGMNVGGDTGRKSAYAKALSQRVLR